MTEPRRIRVSGQPSVREVYMPHWARLRRMATYERIAGHLEAYDDLARLARCVRQEMTDPGPIQEPRA
jgi:hypothetical protein